MTKAEAIEAMKAGVHVTHRYFSSKEWVSMEGNQVIFEDGVKMPSIVFWNMRCSDAWNNDWEIFKEL